MIKNMMMKLGIVAIGLSALSGSAQAAVCSTGSAQKAADMPNWGSYSTCSCATSPTIAGRVKGVDWRNAQGWNLYGQLYIEATSGQSGGLVWGQDEWAILGGSGYVWQYEYEGGVYLTDAPGGGVTNETFGDQPDLAWTGRYRAVCTH